MLLAILFRISDLSFGLVFDQVVFKLLVSDCFMFLGLSKTTVPISFLDEIENIFSTFLLSSFLPS